MFLISCPTLPSVIQAFHFLFLAFYYRKFQMHKGRKNNTMHSMCPLSSESSISTIINFLQSFISPIYPPSHLNIFFSVKQSVDISSFHPEIHSNR